MDAHEPTTWLWREEPCYCAFWPHPPPPQRSLSPEEEFTVSLPCLLVLPDSILLLCCSFGMNVQELLERVPRSGLAMPGVCVPGNSPDKDILFSKEVCVVLYFHQQKRFFLFSSLPILGLVGCPHSPLYLWLPLAGMSVLNVPPHWLSLVSPSISVEMSPSQNTSLTIAPLLPTWAGPKSAGPSGPATVSVT